MVECVAPRFRPHRGQPDCVGLLAPQQVQRFVFAVTPGHEDLTRRKQRYVVTGIADHHELERQLAHATLAEVTDRAIDPDRRAWHRAEAAPGPDEDVAGELERSAGRAQARGGLAAAAAFLERAMMLTPDPARRAGRALAAANTKFQAGAFDAAQDLLAMARAGRLNEYEQARVDLLRAQLAYVSTDRDHKSATAAVASSPLLSAKKGVGGGRNARATRSRSRAFPARRPAKR